jgi:hypothetical protein
MLSPPRNSAGQVARARWFVRVRLFTRADTATTLGDLNTLHQRFERSERIEGLWNGTVMQTFDTVCDQRDPARLRLRVAVRVFCDGFEYVGRVNATLGSLTRAHSATVSNMCNIKSFYVQLGGINDGSIEPLALMPPQIDYLDFVKRVIMPQFERLVEGTSVVVHGTCARRRCISLSNGVWCRSTVEHHRRSRHVER